MHLFIYHFLLKKSLDFESSTSGNLFLNKPVIRRCILPQQEREVVTGSLGISPKAYLRSGADILGKVRSSKSYPQPRSCRRLTGGQMKSRQLYISLCTVQFQS